MIKRILAAVIVLVIAIAGVGYIYSTEILLYFVSQQNQQPIAEYREINWIQGPRERSGNLDDQPPNIILILADDLGINDVSTSGGGVANGRVPTTNIDRIAHEGANFLNSYAGHATCAPSRAILMTGRYPTRTGFEFTPTPGGFGRMVSMMGNESSRGVLPPSEFNQEQADNTPPFAEQGLPPEEVTVAEILRDKGYHTVMIGKWHLGASEGMVPIDQGFNESLTLGGLLHDHEDDPNVVNAKLDFDPIDKFLWARGGFSTSFNSGELFEPSRYLTDYWTDEAVKVIEANKNRPFFLYFGHWAPHTPLQATREDFEAVGYIQPHRLRVYAAMIRAVDRSVGRILDKLEETGLADNTLIVFSSDNGAAGYLGLDDLNAPYRGWKITLFEGGIRAPIYLRWPARIPPNTEIGVPVAHIDVMPTLVEASGAQLPENVIIDGESLLAAATGEGTVGESDRPLFWQSGYTQVVQVEGWKLQVEHRRDKAWLFNLNQDPTEQNNLAQELPEKVRELKGLLAQHQEGRVEPLYPHALESPILIDRHLLEEQQADDEYVFWSN